MLPAAAMLIVSSGPATAQCQYAATVLPPVGCFGSGGEPVAINNRGDVLITRNNCGEPGLHDSFIWTAESGIQPVHPPLGFHGAHVEDLNDAREIVGYAQQEISGPKGTIIIEQACLWRPGETILLGIPAGGNFSIANAINNHSEICGYWGNNVTGPHRAFIWRDGAMTQLELPRGPESVANDINDYSQITGWMGTALIGDAHAFIWDDGKVVDLGRIPEGFTGQGSAIGRSGLVSGWGVRHLPRGQQDQARAAQWRFGQAVDLGMLPDGERMIARGGNSFATVGLCDRPSALGDRGFLHQAGALYDLSEVVPMAIIGMGQDINDRGRILATGRIDGGPNSTLILTPIGQLEGDISHDCRVDTDDLLGVIFEWGQTHSYADANTDGVVDVDDLILVILNWTL